MHIAITTPNISRALIRRDKAGPSARFECRLTLWESDMQALWTAPAKRSSQQQYVGMDEETLCNSAQGFRGPSTARV
jgi:hypothetical protein